MWFSLKVSSHLLCSPQIYPLRQSLVSCLMKGSLLLHISSKVRPGDKGGCWSNRQTNRQWQKHTFVAQHLALISDSAKSQREANPSLWTGAFQSRYFSALLWSSVCRFLWVIIHNHHPRFRRAVLVDTMQQNIHISDREHVSPML